MRATLLLSALPLLLLRAGADGATWYVDASVASSGDGTTWETAFKTIQRGVDAASHGHIVVVAKGLYNESIRFLGKNITLTSTDPLDPDVVAETIIDGVAGAVTFHGTEYESCVLRGFTIRGASSDRGGAIAGPSFGPRSRACIEYNIILENYASGGGGAIASCDGTIRNNVISRNWGLYTGGGLADCNGLIENNMIAENRVGTCLPGSTAPRSARSNSEPDEIYYGAGLFNCNGIIRNNVILRNKACEYNWGIGYAVGYGGGLAECDGVIVGNLICDNIGERGRGGGLYSCNGPLRNNSIVGNSADRGPGLSDCHGTASNCIVWANPGGYPAQTYDSTVPTYSCIQDWIGGGEGNISEEPRFADAENGDFRLRADSPCIDAGFNSPELTEFDIAGMRRIMFGGKSLTVDMGAYEFYINKLEPVPGTDEAVFTWSSLADKTYSIFYTDDLFDWHTAIANFPSSGNETTSWTDEGSLTGLPPLLAPHRFYRILENP